MLVLYHTMMCFLYQTLMHILQNHADFSAPNLNFKCSYILKAKATRFLIGTHIMFCRGSGVTEVHGALSEEEGLGPGGVLDQILDRDVSRFQKHTRSLYQFFPNVNPTLYQFFKNIYPTLYQFPKNAYPTLYQL